MALVGVRCPMTTSRPQSASVFRLTSASACPLRERRDRSMCASASSSERSTVERASYRSRKSLSSRVTCKGSAHTVILPLSTLSQDIESATGNEWQELKEHLEDPSAELSIRDVTAGLKQVAHLASAQGTAAFPTERESHMCIACMDALARGMCAHIDGVDAPTMALAMGVMGMLVQLGYIDARAAPPELVLLGEEIMRRLQGEALGQLSANQIAGVLRCIVMLVPQSVTRGWCEEVEVVTYPRLENLGAEALATTVLALAQLRIMTGWQPTEEWLQVVLRVVLPQLMNFSTSSLAHTIWGLAHLDARPDAEWLDCFRIVVEKRAHEFMPRDLATVLVSYARMGIGFLPGSPNPPPRAPLPMPEKKRLGTLQRAYWMSRDHDDE